MSQSTRRHNPPTAPAPRTPRARARRCSQGGRLGRTRSGPSQTWHLPGTHRALPRRPFKQPYPAGAPPSSPTLAYRVRAQSGGATDAATSQTWARRNCNSPPPFASVPSATISAPFFTAVQRSHASAAGCAGQTNLCFVILIPARGRKICLPPSVIDLIRSSPRRRLRRRTVAGGVGATLRISSVFPLTVADRGAAGSDASVVSNTRLNSWKVG